MISLGLVCIRVGVLHPTWCIWRNLWRVLLKVELPMESTCQEHNVAEKSPHS